MIETADGLPYIGQMTAHQYAATGFAGNGLTFGTLAAMIIADALQKRENPKRLPRQQPRHSDSMQKA